MPRFLHGSFVSQEEFRAARESLATASANLPLSFATSQPVDLQDFDFLFPELQNNPADRLPESSKTVSNLKLLGHTMRDAGEADDAQGDSNIPAGFTYLGQFIDHDITFEAVSADMPRLLDPNLQPLPVAEIRDRIRNIRTATLDLDSVYGLPAPRNGAKMVIGEVALLNGQQKPLLRPKGKGDDNDLKREPRSADPEHDRAALTGDPRNDENTIISQLHLAFLKAHNRIVKQKLNFKQASQMLRQHYQYLVIHDFLKRICDPKVVDRILKKGNKVYDPFAEPFYLPLEFAVAAYRFGHTMIRKNYDFNLNFNTSQEPGTLPASLGLLFTFTALSGQLGGDGVPETDTLPENWIIEWEHFVDVGVPFNKARRIDTKLVEPLFELRNLVGKQEEGDAASLAVRNLLRGYLLRMPTGQAVARSLSLKPLTPDELREVASKVPVQDGKPSQLEVLEQAGFLERTPLWFYVLAEAAARADGEHLGPVGSTIVAEVIIGLIRRSDDSILRSKKWKPTLPSKKKGTFTLADLLRLADVLPAK